MLKFLFRIPYGSLTLLLLTYAIFGWQWVDRAEYWHHYWPIDRFDLIFWTVLVLLTLGLIALITTPLAGLRSWLLRWFESDTRSFIAAVSFTLIGVIVMVHIHWTIDLMILLAAVMLARLELQDRKFNEWFTFWILITISLGGMAIGSIVHVALQ